MEKDEQIHVDDLCRQAKAKNRLVYHFFLDPVGQDHALRTARRHECRAVLWGGYPEAERKMIFFLPDYAEEEDIKTIGAIHPLLLRAGRTGLKHKDYLGALLATGIRRTCIGDILVQDKQAVVFCEAKMSEYIRSSLFQVGRMDIDITDASPADWLGHQGDGRSIRCNVAALRLDAVAAAIFHASRGTVQDWIKSGYVSLNWQPCFHADKILKEGDTLSIRKKGRAILEAIDGHSRKGRTFLRVTHFPSK